MSEEKRQLRVFLCHASQDKPAVRELYSALKIEGWIDPWLDKAKILPGQDWRTVIEKAVEESDVVIVCLSTQSVSKEGFVQREIKYAYDIALEKPEETIFLIPLRLDDCVVPRGLRSFHWVNYFDVEKSDAYSDLLDALKLRYEQKLRIEDELAHREKEQQARESAEKAAREKAEREAAEKAAREKAERESAEKAARAKAIHEAAEKVERVKAEKLERETAEKAARVKTEQEVEKHNSQIEKKPVLQNENSAPKLLQQTKNVSSTSLRNTFIWIGIFGLACIGVVCAIIVLPQLVPNPPDSSSGVPTKTFSVPADVQALPSETLAPSPLPTDTLSPSSTPLPPEKEGGLGVPMVLVPEGEFKMGSTADDALAECVKYQSNCQRDYFLKEEPPHMVWLDSYYIDKYETTNWGFSQFLDKFGVTVQEYRVYYNGIFIYYLYNNAIVYENGSFTVVPGFENQPVKEVSWEAADFYCHWVGARLPTEAEWEKAAHGKDEWIFPWGNTFDCSFGNFGDCVGQTTEVGKYEAGKSQYSAYDMAGNVWEWVADWYSPDYYKSLPDHSKNPVGPDSGDLKIVRGGSWFSSGLELRITYRFEINTSNAKEDFGFRCARDATP